MRFKFPFNLIGKLIVSLLTGHSWWVLKSWYNVGGSEQGLRSCFGDQMGTLVLSVVQARSQAVVTVKIDSR